MAKAAMAILLLLAVAVAAALADTDFVASTCKSSDNLRCAAVLGADPRSANATTVRELASIALDVAAAAARAASGFLSGEADRRDRTDVGDALGDCVGYYGGATDALEAAREDFDAGAYGEAEEEAGDAEGAADRCEQAFTDRRLETSTVSDVDKRMKDGASVAGDLIDLLWGDKRRRHGRRLLRP